MYGRKIIVIEFRFTIFVDTNILTSIINFMMGKQEMVSQPKDFKGSRLRCLKLTHQSKSTFFKQLRDIVRLNHISFGNEDEYFPKGFENPQEMTLTSTRAKLIFKNFGNLHRHPTITKELLNWWLGLASSRRTPNWDIVCTCSISGVKGLLLVEAKAHSKEFCNDSCRASDNSKANINRALTTINEYAKSVSGDIWHLNLDVFYQISNRFAWGWKLASMGIPIVLMYIGFLNAAEMTNPLTNYSEWQQLVINTPKLKNDERVISKRVWENTINLSDGGSLLPIIRTYNMNTLYDI